MAHKNLPPNPGYYLTQTIEDKWGVAYWDGIKWWHDENQDKKTMLGIRLEFIKTWHPLPDEKSRPIIVLQTIGKNEDVTNIAVKLFNSKDVAEIFCQEKTDNPMEEKYWKYAEVIDEDAYYEPAQYKNYKL